jgi:hypothetical protein
MYKYIRIFNQKYFKCLLKLMTVLNSVQLTVETSKEEKDRKRRIAFPLSAVIF